MAGFHNLQVGVGASLQPIQCDPALIQVLLDHLNPCGRRRNDPKTTTDPLIQWYMYVACVWGLLPSPPSSWTQGGPNMSIGSWIMDQSEGQNCDIFATVGAKRTPPCSSRVRCAIDTTGGR